MLRRHDLSDLPVYRIENKSENKEMDEDRSIRNRLGKMKPMRKEFQSHHFRSVKINWFIVAKPCLAAVAPLYVYRHGPG